MSVYSVYVEKKTPYAVEASTTLADLREAFAFYDLVGLRICNRYLIDHIDPDDFILAQKGILTEPQVDLIHHALPEVDGCVFAVEYLPGQFDQRADSCAQCIAIATGKKMPLVRSAKVYLLQGNLSEKQCADIKAYLINPVDSREADLEVPETLDIAQPIPEPIGNVDGFITMDSAALEELRTDMDLAMDLGDLLFCQQHFQIQAERDPTITELRLIDTYWSDHCRHTTFLTNLQDIEIEPEYIRHTYERYQDLREVLYRKSPKPMTLMDMATIGAKDIRRQGLLNRLDISEEINACSVSVRIDVDGQQEDWLLMFKNETHNHPTEIEPFGGAATCLGGAIRDPLSGRSYAYQAMRVTGAGDPLQKSQNTPSGKLRQRKITREAARGYSAYGNQIGLATGLVHEIYHPGYVAKRMEVGAVLGAVQEKYVRRERPVEGDLVILLGGKTGRDGCGGATGSSKSHTKSSLQQCGAQVQKGNPPEERKIQRLFRNKATMELIKRCNDFGAGGVAVAIGELADGLRIDLNAIPKKYDGLNGTELAISESQERMAVVVAPRDADAFIALADKENLEATVVAWVTEEPRLVMEWNGKEISDLPRTFLSSNGAPKYAKVVIAAPESFPEVEQPITGKSLTALMSSLTCCSQKGLGELFDASIGAASVLLPYGGKHQTTPAQVMAAKLPVPHGKTNTCSLMAFAYDPIISSISPYHGAMDAVVHSVAKVIAAGGSRKKCWLTFQEYFQKLGEDPSAWGKPVAALLGALEAQLELQVAAIGGKDSMSGSFEEQHVPPTLISFAVGTAQVDNVIPNVFQRHESYVYLFDAGRTSDKLLDFDDTRIIFDIVEQYIDDKSVISAWAVGAGGTAEAVANLCFGNRIGFEATQVLTSQPRYGSFILETTRPILQMEDCIIGRTIIPYQLRHCGEVIDLSMLEKSWANTLEPVFPIKAQQDGSVEKFQYEAKKRTTPKQNITKPTVLIPVFPGTNCEYDTAHAFTQAGAKTEIFVVRNLTVNAVQQSLTAFVDAVARSQIIAIPGGFSGGDEPDGSAKFITSFMRNPQVSQALMELLNQRDGLMCGICNGFQALIKLGLVPYGELRMPIETSPTLAANTIGRHQSKMVRTRIASNKSPWLMHMQVGEEFIVPISHGEGRLVCSEDLIREMAANGQIATQYVDLSGNPSMDVAFNPNHSAYAIEGITSPDGRIFGKMAHNERIAEGLFRNIPGIRMMDMFQGAVDYFG